MKKFQSIIILIIFIFLFTVFGVWYTYLRSDFTLHLMHTNDLHAHLIPFNPDNRACDYSSKACLGGFARLKTVIDAYRTQYPDTILLDAGDRFSGTVFYTLRKGQDIIKLMNDFHYDAMTLGNHDFDDGLSEIEKMTAHTNAPVVCANIDFSDKDTLKQKIRPALIVERNGQQIGIIGALTEDVKTETLHAGEITLKPFLQSIQQEINRLKQQGINKIILLSHAGVTVDEQLAHQLTDIDIIAGGHTHTLFSNNPTEKTAKNPYPKVVKNAQGKKVLIVSSGYGGQHIGQLSIDFNQKGEIIAYQGDTKRIDADVPVDSGMEAKIKSIEKTLAELLNAPLTEVPFNIPLTPNRLFCSENCHIGEVLTDLIKQTVPEAEIVFLNAGGIRTGLPNGTVTFKHLAQSYPFDSPLILTPMTDTEIRAFLQHGLKNYLPNDRTNAFLQIAGATYTFDPQNRQLKTLIYETPKSQNETYLVAMPSFIANGGDGYPKRSTFKTLPASVRDILKTGLQNMNEKPTLQNRIQTAK